MAYRSATSWTAIAGACLLLLASGVAHGRQADGPQAPNTVLDGVFTAPQADRGRDVYNARCAECHAGADVDGPPLTGTPFVDRWREDTVASLFDFIKTQMPQQAPGSLSDAEYLAIVAHLLRENALPAGPRELTVDSARRTLLVGPGGPQPLPNGALVEVTGCVVKPATQDWVIARATRPSRVRSATAVTPDEAAAAAAAPLGTGTYALQNIEDAGSVLNTSGSGGQKVVVKGALTQRGGAGRIHVTAAKVVADSCGGQ